MMFSMSGISSEIEEYLYTIKAIQDCGGIGLYSLNQRRIELHQKMVEGLGLPQEAYVRMKLFTDNLDKVCELYSTCEEWRLKTDSDVKRMAKYLERLLSSTEAMLYLEGKIQRVHGFNV